MRSRQQVSTFWADIGAWRAIEQGRHCAFNRMHVWDAQGTAAMEFNAEEVDEQRIGCIVENSVTLAGLERALRRATNVRVFCPAKLVALRTTAETGAMQQLDLDDGTTLEARLLVAADGGNSKVRQLAGFESRHWSYEQKAVVATVHTERSHQNTAWQRFGPQGPLAFLPLQDPSQALSSIVWSADTEYADQLLEYSDERFAHELGRAFELRFRPHCVGFKALQFPLATESRHGLRKTGHRTYRRCGACDPPLGWPGCKPGLQGCRCAC